MFVCNKYQWSIMLINYLSHYMILCVLFTSIKLVEGFLTIDNGTGLLLLCTSKVHMDLLPPSTCLIQGKHLHIEVAFQAPLCKYELSFFAPCVQAVEVAHF